MDKAKKAKKEHWVLCHVHLNPTVMLFNNECMVSFPIVDLEHQWTVVDKSCVVASQYVDKKYSDEYNAKAIAYLSVTPTRKVGKKIACLLHDVDHKNILVDPRNIFVATRAEILHQWLPDALGENVYRIHGDRFVKEYPLWRAEPKITLVEMRSGTFVKKTKQ